MHPSPNYRQAVFVLATVCDGHPRGQALCYQANLLGSLLRWLQLLLPGLAALEAQQAAAVAGVGSVGAGAGVSRGAALLVKWCCLALGRLVEDNPEAAAVRALCLGQGCTAGGGLLSGKGRVPLGSAAQRSTLPTW